MNTQTTPQTQGLLGLLSGLLFAAAVVVLLAPAVFSGSLHYPNLPLFALQLLAVVILLSGGFFASVAAASLSATATVAAAQAQSACGGARPTPRQPARTTNPGATHAPAGLTA